MPAPRRNRTVGDAATVDERRLKVSQMLLRGFSVREIQRGLAELRSINPKTNAPWGLATIHADIEHLQAEYRAKAAHNTERHRATLNAKLEEVQRAAWREGDLKSILEALKQQRALLGADLLAAVEAELKQAQLREIRENSDDGTPPESREFVFEVIDGRTDDGPSEADTTAG